MCLNPTNLPNGLQVGCRQCWQCKANIVDDVVGRAIAETYSSTGAVAVTLTYGRDGEGNKDHAKSGMLDMRDVQNYLKRWREDGYELRYVLAGEYGDDFGRAHWHLIIFWQGKVPELEMEKRYLHEKWNAGWSWFEPVHYNSARYALKYVMKEQEKGEKGLHSYSTVPVLGYTYFCKKAIQEAKEGLVPTSPFYTLPGVWKNAKQTTLRKFRLSNTSLDRYLEAYLNAWRVYQPGKHVPPSPFLEKWIDGQARKEKERFRWERRAWRTAPRMPCPRGFHVRYHVTLDKFFAVCGTYRVWFTEYQRGCFGWIEDEDLDNNADRIERETALILPQKLRLSASGPRMGESYVMWRQRTIREERSRSMALSKKPRNVRPN